MQLWEEHGRPGLLAKQQHGPQPQPQQQYLTNGGKPFNCQSLCSWWKELHSKTAATWPFLSMHSIRHTMVREVRGTAGGSSVHEEAAAKLMGHSKHMWDRHYDRDRGGRLVARGQADVLAFRAAQLGKKRGRPASVDSEDDDEGV